MRFLTLITRCLLFISLPVVADEQKAYQKKMQMQDAERKALCAAYTANPKKFREEQDAKFLTAAENFRQAGEKFEAHLRKGDFDESEKACRSQLTELHEKYLSYQKAAYYELGCSTKELNLETGGKEAAHQQDLLKKNNLADVRQYVDYIVGHKRLMNKESSRKIPTKEVYSILKDVKVSDACVAAIIEENKTTDGFNIRFGTKNAAVYDKSTVTKISAIDFENCRVVRQQYTEIVNERKTRSILRLRDGELISVQLNSGIRCGVDLAEDMDSKGKRLTPQAPTQEPSRGRDGIRDR